MLRYAGRRLLQMIPVFFGATLLIYAMVFALPGDPVAAMGGERALNPDLQAQIRAQYNLDQPFLVQYFLFLKGLVTFDLGTTIRGSRPIVDVLAGAYPVTIKLALMALVFEAVAGVGIGLFAGMRKGGIFDATVLILSLVVIAVPTRTEVGENLSADHVRMARAKGLSSRRVMVVHVLRNSLVPVVTFLGADLGALMGGAIVTEGIFNIDGVGGTLYKAIINGEGPTVVAFTTVLILVFIVSNLLVDLLYAALDPRIRYA